MKKRDDFAAKGTGTQEQPAEYPEPAAVYPEVRKVLVVSDSHGRDANLLEIFHRMAGYMDLVIHLGDFTDNPERLYKMVDCPVELVRGNCDSAVYKQPLHRLIQIGKHRVLISHGHTLGVKMGTERICEAARQMGADVAMFGHTHIPVQVQKEGVTLVNPGSVSLPRQDGHRPTYLVMNLSDGRTEFNLVTM